MDATKTVSRVLEKHSGAKPMFDTLAGRSVARDVIDVRRLKGEMRESGVKISTDELVAIFKELETQGLGTLVAPRTRNDPHRFQLKKGLTSVQLGRAGQTPNPGMTTAASVARRPATTGLHFTLPWGEDMLTIPLENVGCEDIEALILMLKRHLDRLR